MAMALCRRGGALIIKSIPFYSSSVCRSFSSSSSNVSRGLRPVIALTELTNRFSSTKTILPAAATLKSMFTTTTSSVSDPKPNNNYPPEENTVLEDFDFECWIMLIRLPEGDPEIIVRFFNTLTDIIESEEESRIRIYSCYDGYYFAFGAFSEELANKIEELAGVPWVQPASYLDDLKNGVERLINGKAAQPGSSEIWMRNTLREDMQRERDVQSTE